MRIAIGTDHAGFEMKEELCEFLQSQGYEVSDLGAHQLDETDDYPDFVAPVAKAVSDEKADFGIVLGGSGQGEAIVANKFKGIRAIVYNGKSSDVPDEIILSREHNNANILSIGARFISLEEAKEIVLKWLSTDFSGEERHVRRIQKIRDIENSLRS